MVSQPMDNGLYNSVAADTQQWSSCHTTVEQPSHNNGTTVTVLIPYYYARVNTLRGVSRTSTNSVVLLMCKRGKSYRITTSEHKLVSISYLGIYFIVKYT